MRVLLDEQYFATADSLEVIAEIGDIDVSRLSFHPDDIARAKERAAEEEFEAEMLAIYSSVTELIATIAADDSPGRSGGPRRAAQERLAKLRERRGF